MDSGYIQDSLLVEQRFRIPIDSLISNGQIPKQKFPGFRNPDSLCTSNYFWEGVCEGVWGIKNKPGSERMRYLKYNTEDGQTIRNILCLAEVVVFSVMADKLNLQIEMRSLDMCNIFSTVILASHSFLQLYMSPLGVAVRLSKLPIGSFYLFKMLFSVFSLSLSRLLGFARDPPISDFAWCLRLFKR